MSGPLPDTTDVSILVTSSFAVANSSHLTVAPVWALNWFPTSCRQALICSGNWVFVLTTTSSVLPAPLVPPPPPLPPPLLPHAASPAASVTPARIVTAERTVLDRIG